MYSYDPVTGRYYYTSKIGDFNINYPVILTPKEFQELLYNENLKAYYKEKIDAYEGLKGEEDDRKNLIPDMYVNSKFFESIFGSNVISVVPQGSVEMDLGIMYTKQ
jgi:cell surface protein SprA